MKTLKTTIAIILITIVSGAFATTNPISKSTSIEKEIKTTLKKIDVAKYDIEEEKAEITFTLNEKNEIEIKKINTKSKELKHAILEQLDGMISKAELSTKTNYSIKISFVVLN